MSGQRYVRLVLSAVFFLLISGCEVTAPKEQAGTGGKPPDWQQRMKALVEATDWTVSGKLSVRRGNRVDVGHIRQWQQRGEAFDIDIASAVLGLGATRVTGDDEQLILATSEDAPQLIALPPQYAFQEAFGWPLPARQIRSWIKGIPSPGASAATLEFTAGGQLSEIRQDGWVVNLKKYSKSAPELPELPGFIQLTRSQTPTEEAVVIRMAIAEWSVN